MKILKTIFSFSLVSASDGHVSRRFDGTMDPKISIYIRDRTFKKRNAVNMAIDSDDIV